MNPIFPLFSYPVMLCVEKYKFSEQEESFIAGLSMSKNLGNNMSENDRILECNELQSLKGFIAEQLECYEKNVLQLKSKNEIAITQSWVNKSNTNEFHPMHKHPNSLISGVFFVSGEQGDGLPPIRFHRSNDLLRLDLEFEAFNEYNTGVRWFIPEKGLLILFPSVLLHDVDRNATESERISISFNTFVKGPLGKKSQLTEVNPGEL